MALFLALEKLTCFLHQMDCENPTELEFEVPFYHMFGCQMDAIQFHRSPINSIFDGFRHLVDYLETLCVIQLLHTPLVELLSSNQVQQQTSKAYSTSLANCGSKSCPSDKKTQPSNV